VIAPINKPVPVETRISDAGLDRAAERANDLLGRIAQEV
jgi:hypothetical protein